MKQKIREVIVVEGKNDTHALQTAFDCDTIETGGDRVNEQILERIAKAQAVRGVIVFTDPDHSGEHIRRVIAENIPGCKHAFIEKNKAKTTRKVGVEHARTEDLRQALEHVVTFEEGVETLSWGEFVDLGLTGHSDSAQKREQVCRRFHIGICNAKTCFKRLNQMRITSKELREELS